VGRGVAAAVLGFLGLRDRRIDERIDLKVRPNDLHKTLERIEEKVDGLDSKVDAITERTARLEGALDGSQGVVVPAEVWARISVKGN
jgi:hypothetical protein